MLAHPLVCSKAIHSNQVLRLPCFPVRDGLALLAFPLGTGFASLAWLKATPALAHKGPLASEAAHALQAFLTGWAASLARPSRGMEKQSISKEMLFLLRIAFKGDA